MQKERTGKNIKDYITTFKNLINSIKNNGFNNNYPIEYYGEYLLLNGSHRLAFSYLKIYKFIPIKKCSYIPHASYSIEWFKKNNFNANELNLINNELNELNMFIW